MHALARRTTASALGSVLVRPALVLSALVPGIVTAQSTRAVSVDSSGAIGEPFSNDFDMTPDGRFVVFASRASNLVANDGNAFQDIFLHDNVTRVTERLSVSVTGGDANSEARWPAITADGRYVVFVSSATNLVAVPSTGVSFVFVRDRLLQQTRVASVSSTGSFVGVSSAPAISRDGRFVAFETTVTTVVPGDTNARPDVFVHDLALGTTVCASVDAAGTPRGSSQPSSGFHAYPPAISGDGRYVAFTSGSDNLVPNDTNGLMDVFVRDLVLGQTMRISVSATGVEADGESYAPAITPDGRYVAYFCNANNLATPHGGWFDVLVHDRVTGQTRNASVSSAGVSIQGSHMATFPSISSDGRHVAFLSPAPALVPNDTNARTDAFVHDFATGETRRASVDSLGNQLTLGALIGDAPVVSDDGRCVAFSSYEAFLAPFDALTSLDVFVHDSLATLTEFCGADGNPAHGCPCANQGAVGRGCANSAFADGAQLVATGDSSVANDSVVLDAQSLTGGICIFYLGDQSGSPAVLDDGLGCVSGSIVRIASKPVGGNASVYPEPGDATVSTAAGVPAIGGRRFVQCVYRNAASFCTSATSNRTNAVAVTFTP
jgi:Tol biopolymer transport system component